jgi:hypothetical protein
MAELIDLDMARQHIPNSRDLDEPVITTLVQNATKAIQRYCRRDFVSTAYDELYHGSDDPVLILKQYPIQSVQSVRTSPQTVLEVQNSLATNQQARVSVTATGIVLKRISSGTAAINTVTFAGNGTLGAMAAAIGALGNGWTAQAVSGYEDWPSADLFAPQGAYDARGSYAGLKLHARELQAFGIDAQRGYLYWDHLDGTEKPTWTPGWRNYRVQYTGGFSTIPEDVQEACAELVASWFANRGRDIFLSQENIKGSNFYSTEQTRGELPGRVKALLRPYRNHRV